MKAIYYAQPFYKALMQGASYDVSLATLQKNMAERGHIKLYPAVLNVARQLFEVQLQKDTPKLTLANTDDLARYTKKIATHGVDTAECSVTINPNIIGGYILTHQNTRHDATYKSALYKTYQNITSTL